MSNIYNLKDLIDKYPDDLNLGKFVHKNYIKIFDTDLFDMEDLIDGSTNDEELGKNIRTNYFKFIDK